MFNVSATAEMTSDLPPRTWRQWWRQLPGYWRIAGWTALGLVVLHVAVAARMAIGHIEEREIRNLRRQGAWVEYDWDFPPEPFHGYSLLIAGLRGKSCSNVNLISWRHATDDDLIQLSPKFRNLNNLFLMGSDVTGRGLSQLGKYPQLGIVNLQDANVTDEDVAQLVCMEALIHLELSGTRVTDAGLSKLQQIKSLKRINVAYTAVTEAGLQQNDKSRTYNESPPFGYVWGTIHWLDGQQSRRYDSPFTILLEGPLSLEDRRVEKVARDRLENRVWFMTTPLTSGEYRAILKIGDYESEPVVINVSGGIAFPDRIEFHMPITKTEAVRAVGE